MNLSWFTNNSQNSLHTSNHLLIEITFLGIILWNKRIFALSNGCQKFPKASQSVLRNVLWHWLCVALIVCRNPSLIWREPFSFGFLRLQLCLELVWCVCWCMLTGRFCGHRPFEKLFLFVCGDLFCGTDGEKKNNISLPLWWSLLLCNYFTFYRLFPWGAIKKWCLFYR